MNSISHKHFTSKPRFTPTIGMIDKPGKLPIYYRGRILFAAVAVVWGAIALGFWVYFT